MATAPASRVAVAPGDLELVQRFVNTEDLEEDTDVLADPGSLARWMDELGAHVPAGPGDEELVRARRLRAALRTALEEHHAGAGLLSRDTARALTRAAEESELHPVFTPSGVALSTPADGVDALLGRVVAAVAAGIADGTWNRLKVCANHACGWAFYDRSRSRSAQWCSMAICGNRAKQARWRAQTTRSGDDRGDI